MKISVIASHSLGVRKSFEYMRPEKFKSCVSAKLTGLYSDFLGRIITTSKVMVSMVRLNFN